MSDTGRPGPERPAGPPTPPISNWQAVQQKPPTAPIPGLPRPPRRQAAAPATPPATEPDPAAAPRRAGLGG